MNDLLIIACIGLALLIVPAAIYFVCAEYAHQKRIRKYAAAQKIVAQTLRGRAAK